MENPVLSLFSELLFIPPPYWWLCSNFSL